MRYLVTLLFAALSFNAFSQNNAIHVYPWNPDANQDNEIGMGDLLPFLSVYGEEFGLPPEPCTYDGTDFEEFIAGLITQDIILDSLFFEYQIEDISTYFIAGCPDTVTDTLVFSESGTLYQTSLQTDRFKILGNGSNGYNILEILFNFSNGGYTWYWNNFALSSLGYSNDGFFGGSDYGSTETFNIPWPEDWFYDESGISINWDGWPAYANYMHILPYWHYADE
jgi:hypothetical protein